MLTGREGILGAAGCIVMSLGFCLAPQAARADSRTEAFCSQANASWSDATSIPPNRPWTGEFVESYDMVRQRIEVLIDEALRSPTSRAAKRIADLYSAAVEARRASATPTALAQALADVDGYRTQDGLARLVARAGRVHRDLTEGSTYAVPAPFLITVWLDDAHPTRSIASLNQSGLGLPGREYYLDAPPAFVAMRERYLREIQGALAYLGQTEAAAAADVLKFETDIARLQWSSTQLQDRSAGRRTALPGLMALAPAFDWAAYLDEAGLPRGGVLSLPQPSYVSGVTALFRDAPARTVKNYFRWQLMRHYAHYLPEELGGSIAAFYRQGVLGSKEVPTSREVAITLVETYLAHDLEDLYLQRFFPPESKRIVTGIGDDVRAAFIRRLRRSTVLSSGAKAEAVRKIRRLHIQIGFPESSRGSRGIDVRQGDLLGSLMDLSEAAYREQLGRLQRRVDARRWWLSPLSVNASYSQSANTLIVPAGRLQAPLFDAGAADEANFGGVGTLIGHEMGHAIDNQGRHYDRSGRIREWWTAQDERSFEERTQRLVRQYSGYEALPGERIDGAATLSENIADLVGLTIAHEALRHRKGGTLDETQQRRFMQAWAQRWRAKYSPQLLLRVVRSDTHPPSFLRCSGALENFGPFYDSMGMSRPENLLSIW